jgi:hypothetical protein
VGRCYPQASSLKERASHTRSFRTEVKRTAGSGGILPPKNRRIRPFASSLRRFATPIFSYSLLTKVGVVGEDLAESMVAGERES